MRTTILAALCLALTACGGGPQQQPPNLNYRANVAETLDVGLASASVAPYLNAIENDPAFTGDKIGFQAMPQYAPRLRAIVATKSYTDAFDDARAKAQALASHLGARLGAVRSISEVSRTFDNGFARTNALNQEAKGSSNVSTEPNGLTTLAVVFASDRGEVTVYGSHAADQRARDSLQNANGVSLMLNARGQSLADASALLRTLDTAARRIAARYGADASRITVQAANISSY